MALKKCKECGNEVSTKARNCPNCGAPIKNVPVAGCIGCLSIISAIFFLGILITLIDGNDSTTTPSKTNVSKTNWRTQNNSTMAYLMMEDFVKQRLKAPKSADFPGILDGRADHIKYLGNQKYRIISYVDAQNLFGAQIRNYFIGEIEQKDEDKWYLISLEFVEK